MLRALEVFLLYVTLIAFVIIIIIIILIEVNLVFPIELWSTGITHPSMLLQAVQLTRLRIAMIVFIKNLSGVNISQ